MASAPEQAMTPFHDDGIVTLYEGDCRDVMRELEPESVQCVVTSPPYFSLRDYGIPPSTWANGWVGTLGLEPTMEQYLENILEVFAAIRRVLRPDGTVWLNIGDSYAGGTSSAGDGMVALGSRHRGGGHKAAATEKPDRQAPRGLKPKDRMMMPARVALALQADGWWIRDEIVWHKSNPMPSSVDDRTTPAHEMVYLLSKRARYHFDAAAIEEPAVTTRPELLAFGDRPELGYPGHSSDRRREKVPGGWMVGPGTHGTIQPEGRTAATYAERPATDSRWPRGWAHGENRGHDPQVGHYEPPAGHVREVGASRNKRSVWTIATQPYPDAHFATFPPKLVEPMILAGARPGDVVLDPFGGSGTVGMVARGLGRRAILVDLSPDYLRQAVVRSSLGLVDPGGPLADDGLFAAVGE